MAQITISKGNHTAESIKAALSTLGHSKIWQGTGIQRVYCGQVYAQIIGDQIVIANNLKAAKGLSEAAEAIQSSSCEIVEVAPVVAAKAAISKARAYDNLYNEGVRDGGYNPYRSAQPYSSFRELSRHMVAEGGDR